MGTFHEGLGELHGITVVVDTHGPRIYVGRCWEADAEGIVLLDAEHNGASPKEEFLRRAARTGPVPREAKVSLGAGEIASIRRLGAVAQELLGR